MWFIFLVPVLCRLLLVTVINNIEQHCRTSYFTPEVMLCNTPILHLPSQPTQVSSSAANDPSVSQSLYVYNRNISFCKLCRALHPTARTRFCWPAAPENFDYVVWVYCANSAAQAAQASCCSSSRPKYSI